MLKKRKHKHPYIKPENRFFPNQKKINSKSKENHTKEKKISSKKKIPCNINKNKILRNNFPHSKKKILILISINSFYCIFNYIVKFNNRKLKIKH